MEVELESEDETPHFPNIIKVIKEVTGDDSYKNSKLAEFIKSEVE